MNDDRRIIKIWFEDGEILISSLAYYFTAKQIKQNYRIGRMINFGTQNRPDFKTIAQIKIIK